jgi:hypothetical protein
MGLSTVAEFLQPDKTKDISNIYLNFIRKKFNHKGLKGIHKGLKGIHKGLKEIKFFIR